MKDGECSVAWSRMSGLNTATLGKHEEAIWESVVGSAFNTEMNRLPTEQTYLGILKSEHPKRAMKHAIQRADQAIIALRELEEEL